MEEHGEQLESFEQFDKRYHFSSDQTVSNHAQFDSG